MRVRALLAAALLALVASASAQTPTRIGIIWTGTASAPRLAAFKDGMRENGLIEGKQYMIEERAAEGDYERFPALTRELLQHNSAVILVSTIAAVRAAQQATKTVAIVFPALNDPVASGLVASLARPGGNTTGLTTQADDTVAKSMQHLREILPRAKRIAVLLNPGNSSNPRMLYQVRSIAAAISITTRAFEATTTLDKAFGAIALYRPDALVVLRDAMLIGQHERISAFGRKSGIPVFAPASEFVDSGSLIAYSPSLVDMYRRSATYVARIMAGAKPADLPIEQPTKFELLINMKTAKSLGIKIPQSLLISVDRVIE